MKLEPGTVEALYNSQTSNPLYKSPILQITSLGKLSVAIGDKQRYRVNLSDGVNYMKGIFSSELTPHFEKGLVSKYSLIRPGRFSVRSKDGSVYIYIQEIQEYEDCNVEIGKPVNISTGNASFSDNQPSPGNLKRVEVNQQHWKQADEEDKKRVKRDSNCDGEFTAINMLNPFHNKWVIKGRVVVKGDIRRFTNQKGEGKVFNFELSDGTAQVKIICFSDCVDIFFPIVEVGKVYTVTKGTVKMANKQYSTNPFDYEIILDKNSEVRCAADDGSPRYFFNFTKISDISLGSAYCDVIGVVKEAYGPSTVMVRSTQNELLKRDVVLVDESGSVRLTLWGQKAEIDIEEGVVIGLKSIKVSEFNGISISTTGGSQVVVNPDISEAHELAGWYQSIGKNMQVTLPRKEEKRRLVQEVKENELAYSTIQGTVMFLKEDALWYASCKGEGCNKKVMIEEGGNYRCERCNMTYEDCNYRYMVTMHLGDFTGQIWVSLFDEAATGFFGISAKEMKEMSEESPAELQALIRRMCFRECLFRIKSKQDNYNDELRMRYSGLSVSALDILKESKRLLDVIEKA
ncbi:replication factor A protein 1 [Encephalitozoon hellem ATCC 50504]|uniref:Replication protein A subunit n=1 Tax=Encephalitozoon hellem TaxID=27973 RepID=A0A9Q9F8X0_ENCHE|nr:replication factor A protein 1 [Encephalitozoon hellem ATCC 50504]AFM99153.1 replication factor A protein 1 [Encephalitozoon hellem ATCC 50504]UTX44139.1 replication factor-a protein 1 [Encephalitozoon hellem]|eukprot:XP_003888134.1 replication factor A protein 1 [Encephalitozoon hellem ATCC 50504]